MMWQSKTVSLTLWEKVKRIYKEERYALEMRMKQIDDREGEI